MMTEKTEILAEFKDQLTTLIAPNKNSIVALTFVAEDQIAFAAELTATIEARLLTAPPEGILAPLYLLDSIVKTVGGAYKTEFSLRIGQLFPKIYQQAAAHDRPKLVKLLDTWPEDIIAPGLLAQIRQQIKESQPPIFTPVPQVPVPIPPNVPLTSFFPGAPMQPVTIIPHPTVPFSFVTQPFFIPQPQPIVQPMPHPIEPQTPSVAPRTELEVEAVRKNLHRAPHQCHTCGFRFSDKNALGAHYDWHYREKNRESTRKKPISRQWFLTVPEWIDDAGYEAQPVIDPAPFFTEPEAPVENDTAFVLVGDRSIGECAHCGEHFAKRWDDEMGEWVFDDCIESGYQLLHPKCLLSDSVSDDEE